MKSTRKRFDEFVVLGESVEHNGTPDDRLTGGTVLVLLTAAFKSKTDAPADCSLTMPGFLIAILKVVRPNWKHPRGETFEQNASRYRSCQSHTNSYMLQCDPGFLDEFTTAITTDYAGLMDRISAAVDTFLDTHSKAQWLSQALLTLLSRDTSINDQEDLYAVPSGKPVTKQVLLASPSVCLDSLILGLWYYALTRGLENEKGHETFKRWHKPRRTATSRWIFERDRFKADTTLTPVVTRWQDYDGTKDSNNCDEILNDTAGDNVVEGEIIGDDGNWVGDNQSASGESGSAGQQAFINVVGNNNTVINNSVVNFGERQWQ